MNRLLHLIPPLLWTCMVAVLSLMDSSAVPSRNWMDAVHADKLVHAFLYGVMYLLYLRSFRRMRIPANVICMSLIISIITGIVIEMLQWQMAAGRCFELLDIMANITGVLITAFIIKK